MDMKAYWEQVDPPTSFTSEGWPYKKRREFRYRLLPYLPKVANFKGYRGKRVLEVGCGSGIDAVEFARHGAIVTALDFSEKAVGLTSEAFLETKQQEGCVIQSDADNLPFDEGTFDLVYCFGVLHHIPDPVPAVKEIARVLKPGGDVFAMLYHRDSLLYAYSILARGERECLTPDQAMRHYSERVEGCPYSKAYGRREAEKLFRDFGLDVGVLPFYPRVDEWDVNVPQRSLIRKTQLFDRWTDRAPSHFGWHLIVRGMKPRRSSSSWLMG